MITLDEHIAIVEQRIKEVQLAIDLCIENNWNNPRMFLEENLRILKADLEQLKKGL